MTQLKPKFDPFEPGHCYGKLTREQYLAIYRNRQHYKQGKPHMKVKVLCKEFGITPAFYAMLIHKINRRIRKIRNFKQDQYDVMRLLKENKNAFDQVDVWSLDIPWKIRWVLSRNNIETVQQVMDMDPMSLLQVNGMGPKTCVQVQQAIEAIRKYAV